LSLNLSKGASPKRKQAGMFELSGRAPRRCWTHTARCPYAVTAWTTRWLSWPGPRSRAHAPRARPARAAFATAGQPAGPGKAPQLFARATHSILPRIRSGAAQSRPTASVVGAGRSSPVRPIVHCPSSSPSTTIASTHTPCTLPCTRRSPALPRRRPALLRRRGPPCEDCILSWGLRKRTGGPSVKGILNPRFEILNLKPWIQNNRKIGKIQTQLF
jgi:hypothetical protein